MRPPSRPQGTGSQGSGQQLEPGEIFDSAGADNWRTPSPAAPRRLPVKDVGRADGGMDSERPHRNAVSSVSVGGSVGVASAGGGILGSLYEDGEIQDVGEYEEISSGMART